MLCCCSAGHQRTDNPAQWKRKLRLGRQLEPDYDAFWLNKHQERLVTLLALKLDHTGEKHLDSLLHVTFSLNLRRFQCGRFLWLIRGRRKVIPNMSGGIFPWALRTKGTLDWQVQHFWSSDVECVYRRFQPSGSHLPWTVFSPHH